jgi:predicted O-methyltransferase YrrM
MIPDAIESYILAHIDREGEQLAALNRTAHVRLLRPRMIAGHLQGQTLKMFCRMIRPRRVLEIGTYTAYATLCMAEGLDSDARIDTVEINDEMEPFIRPWIAQSPHREKIRIHWGDIRDVLPALGGTFDLVYIDGDKREYCTYYDLVFPVVRTGGFILADNTLWSGKVTVDALPPPPSDRQTQGILAFNRQIRDDRRVEKIILPLRDGLTILHKL